MSLKQRCRVLRNLRLKPCRWEKRTSRAWTGRSPRWRAKRCLVLVPFRKLRTRLLSKQSLFTGSCACDLLPCKSLCVSYAGGKLWCAGRLIIFFCSLRCLQRALGTSSRRCFSAALVVSSTPSLWNFLKSLSGLRGFGGTASRSACCVHAVDRGCEGEGGGDRTGGRSDGGVTADACMLGCSPTGAPSVGLQGTFGGTDSNAACTAVVALWCAPPADGPSDARPKRASTLGRHSGADGFNDEPLARPLPSPDGESTHGTGTVRAGAERDDSWTGMPTPESADKAAGSEL